MERNDNERGPDTGEIELKRIINCLKDNNYEFEDLTKTTTRGTMVAIFNKDIKYTAIDGNYANDQNIKIKLEFDSDFDYKNTYKDRNGDIAFNKDKGLAFIDNLLGNHRSSSSARSSNRSSARSRSNRSSARSSSSNRSSNRSRSSGGTRKRLIKRKR